MMSIWLLSEPEVTVEKPDLNRLYFRLPPMSSSARQAVIAPPELYTSPAPGGAFRHG